MLRDTGMKKKKGRPVTNVRLHELMAKHHCSRTWAYKLLKKEAKNKVSPQLMEEGDGFWA